jgi:ferredoxin-NADP reductase
MPHDTNKKLAFIAGGIGVTPFRSMLKYLIDSAEPRDITVLYSARTDNDIAYRDIFEEARQKLGIQTTYALSESKSQSRYPNTIYGFITSEMIEQYIPDYLDRIFYISGTHPMVQAMHAILSDLGVHRSNIVIDYFPGYA